MNMSVCVCNAFHLLLFIGSAAAVSALSLFTVSSVYTLIYSVRCLTGLS